MLRLLRPYRADVAKGLLALLFTHAFAALGPWILKLGIEAIEDGPHGPPLWRFAILLVLAAGCDGVFRYASRLLLIRASRFVEYDVRRSLHEHLQRMPVPALSRFDVGDLMARITNDLNAVRMFIGPGLMYTSGTALALIFCITLMLRLSPELALVAIAPLPVMTIAVVLVTRAVHTRVALVQEGFAHLTTRVRESLSGIRIIRAHAREEGQIALFEEASNEYLRRNLSLARVQRVFMPAMMLFTGLALALVLWRGGLLVMSGHLSLGDFVAFTGYLFLLMWPMAALGWTINLFLRGAAAWNRIEAILLEEQEPLLERGAHPDGAGTLGFENVTFSFGERPVLRGVTFDIPAGTTVALVGPTGCGKTTLLALLARLRVPDSGRILLDGTPLPEWSLTSLRREMAFVPQDPFLFSDTILANLLVGHPQATPENVHDILHEVSLAEDISGFSRGLDTRIGERGVALSGGQRQRATLARALLRCPRLLVLDDPFSNMDGATEELILQRIDSRLRDCTVLLTSHRPSTLRRVDHIVFLKEGRIVEEGSPGILADAGGHFAHYLERQNLAEGLREDAGDAS
ncbi:MAG: ABC transporter ATP-binding protein [Gemmatimonadota bacterium]|jgi:ATP-binding cassette subfamily B protein|nr:ABC transporter ATP-binding protein [Gemmatimonadota bacterium]MDP7031598.1 ABC transporter ATP-binding protein [Gemmatimonadota bacterium]